MPAPIVDIAIAKENLSGNKDFFLELIGIFLKQFPEVFSELKRKIQAADYSGVRGICHDLNGSLGFLGASQLLNLVHEIGAQARSAKFTEIDAKLGEFECSVKELEQEVERIKNGSLWPD